MPYYYPQDGWCFSGRLLKEFRPVIICELHHPDAVREIYVQLGDLQYKIEKIPGYNHIIAWPKG